MASTPQYAATPKVGLGQVSVANTNRDGTGTIATIFTAGASGSRIDQIRVHSVAATTAGMIRLFIHDGTNAHLWKEILVSAITPGASTPAWAATLAVPTDLELPLVLPAGYSLRAATDNAETFNVICVGGDF